MCLSYITIYIRIMFVNIVCTHATQVRLTRSDSKYELTLVVNNKLLIKSDFFRFLLQTNILFLQTGYQRWVKMKELPCIKLHYII